MRSLLVGALGASLFLPGSDLFAQQEPLPREQSPVGDPLLRGQRTERLLQPDRIEGTEPQAGDADGLAVPYSRIIRDTEPPYEQFFRQLDPEATVRAKAGEGAARFHADFLRGFRFNTPLGRGTRPEDAELKIGDFYMDIRSLSGTVLYSDNVHLSQNNREDGVIGSINLNVGLMYQLGENFRVGVYGALVYLPFENEFGVAGFGVNDILGQFDMRPLAQAQLAYDLYIGKWQVQLIDDLLARHRAIGDALDFELFEGFDFDEQDIAGRYRTRSFNFPVGGTRNDLQDEVGTEFIEIRNRAGVIADRMLPTVTRAELGAFHENRWYTGDRPSGLPDTLDYAYANLISERETMRFKPYVQYRIYKYDTDDDWSQRLIGGVWGPITDYVSFRGEGGWHHEGNSEQDFFICRLMLEHNPTRLFYHRLAYTREITEPDRDLEERWTYRIRYRINEDLRMELYGIRSTFEDLDNTNTGGEEYRAGIRFIYNIANRTLLRLSGAYSHIDSNHPLGADTETWTGRAEIRYLHTDTMDSRLIYQFKTRDSSVPLDSYHENLVVYTLTKYF